MIDFADLYCGAGGATTGLCLSVERRGMTIRSGVAINHEKTSIKTHSRNHPKIKHLCQSIDKVDPCEAVPGGRLDILWASPECTHHSVAAGGRPKQNQSRAGASHILTWIDKLYVRNIIVENVPAFENWGPLDSHGHPLKSGIGKNFHAFLDSLRARNYNVDYRVLNAADYGDATTRQRLFIIARRKPLKIVWPTPTHCEQQTEDLFRKVLSWKPVEDCLDMADLGQDLMTKKRKKFLLCRCDRCDRDWSVQHVAGRTVICKDCKQPPVQTATELPLAPNSLKRIASGLIEHGGLQFVIGQHTGSTARRTSKPCQTIMTDGAISLITPFLIQTDQTGGNGKCQRSTQRPHGTLVTKQNTALIHAFAKTGKFMVNIAHGTTNPSDAARRTFPTSRPTGTLTTSDHQALCSFLIEYYGTGGTSPTSKPCPTLTTKDRFMLINAETNERAELVIFFRLLKPRELAAIHSFPADYYFAGNKSQIVRQIGNSNPCELKAALTNMVL